VKLYISLNVARLLRMRHADTRSHTLLEHAHTLFLSHTLSISLFFSYTYTHFCSLYLTYTHICLSHTYTHTLSISLSLTQFLSIFLTHTHAHFRKRELKYVVADKRSRSSRWRHRLMKLYFLPTCLSRAIKQML
jgi:hypothetical protein